jgi:Fur family ferric uptake transcriptional regulator
VSLPAIQVSQTPEEKFREYLASRPKPQRFTGQARTVVQQVFAKHSHFDTDQLIDDLKAAGLRVSRATVYRLLRKLVDAGLLRRLEIGPRTFFEHDYGYPQHEHLVCERCGKMIEFQHPAIEAALRDVCADHQFHSNGHTLIVRGTCVECNRARAAKRRLDLV